MHALVDAWLFSAASCFTKERMRLAGRESERERNKLKELEGGGKERKREGESFSDQVCVWENVCNL